MIQHFVITRFNLRAAYSGTDRQGQPVLGPGWMRERIELFERFCLPSMVHQVNQNFTWLVLLDEATDPEFAARVESHQEGFRAMRTLLLPPIADDREIGQRVAALVDERTELLLTTRLDNDDAFHERAIETIQAKARRKREFLNFRVGWTQDGTTAWLRFHKYGHFITLAEPRTREPFLTVHNGLVHGRSKTPAQSRGGADQRKRRRTRDQRQPTGPGSFEGDRVGSDRRGQRKKPGPFRQKLGAARR